MHILAIVVLVIISILHIMSFCYENYTLTGRLQKPYRETRPSVHVVTGIAIIYLFYYYFGA